MATLWAGDEKCIFHDWLRHNFFSYRLLRELLKVIESWPHIGRRFCLCLGQAVKRTWKPCRVVSFWWQCWHGSTQTQCQLFIIRLITEISMFLLKVTYEHSQTIASQGRLGDSLSDGTCDYYCYGSLMVRVSKPSLWRKSALIPSSISIYVTLIT